MRTKRTFGVAISRRESARNAFVRCKPVLQAHGEIIVAKNLDLDVLSKQKRFLESDAIFVFGGDGSFLKVAQAIHTTTPLYAIGCGERNFLSDIACAHAANALSDILNNKIVSKPRIRIQAQGFGTMALNELLIVPKQSANILHYELEVDGLRRWHDYADGVLVATPTGASAYNQAAGGPQIDPNASALVITPLHSIENQKPLVVAKNSTIRIHKIHTINPPLELIVDGQQRIQLRQNELTITQSPHPLWIGVHPTSTKTPPLRAPPTILTPSSRFVWQILRFRGTLTQTEIATETGLDTRTIRRAVRQLLDHHLITKRPFGADHRQDLYHCL